MARVKGGVVSRKRRKRILKLAKGYYGAKHILFPYCKRTSNELFITMHTVTVVKRNVTSVNCGSHGQCSKTRLNGLSYSQLMHGLKLVEIEINCKMLC